MSKKKCIVTGCAGFIGSHLCELLIEQGHDVYGMDNLLTGSYENVRHLDNNKFFFTKCDVRKSYIPDIKEVDWVFHLAARADVVPSIEIPELYFDTNVAGTVRMLEYARELNAKKFIYAASSSCYGDDPITPTDEMCKINTKYPYALTKYLGEQCVLHWGKVYGLQATSLRLFNVYGPRARTSGAYGAVMGVFLSQIANKKPLTIVGDGMQGRDFTHVKDVARAFLMAADGDSNGVYNIGTGQAQSIKYLAHLFGRDFDVEGNVELLPDRPGEPRITQANYTKANLDFSWAPTIPFDEGAYEMLSKVDLFKDAPLWDKQKIAKATATWFEYMT